MVFKVAVVRKLINIALIVAAENVRIVHVQAEGRSWSRKAPRCRQYFEIYYYKIKCIKSQVKLILGPDFDLLGKVFPGFVATVGVNTNPAGLDGTAEVLATMGLGTAVRGCLGITFGVRIFLGFDLVWGAAAGCFWTFVLFNAWRLLLTSF